LEKIYPRAASGPAAIAVARAVGHTVAIAHMANHALGTAYYALKAIKATGKSTETELLWQDKHLPSEIAEPLISARRKSQSLNYGKRTPQPTSD
jgi:hypothetical protein